LLLRSAPSFEPPPFAEEEVWRKLRPLTAIGAAAAATTMGTHAAAGSKLVGKAFWLAVLKWGAVVAVAGPTVAGTTRWALHRRDVSSYQSAQRTTGAVATPPPVDNALPAATLATLPGDDDALKPGWSRGGGPVHAAHGLEAPSALRAESNLLAIARAKLASGDAQGALDDIGRLTSRFPRGKLTQEREVVAIDSLAALGNHQAARSRGLAFLERFPDGPYSAHVRQVVEP